MKVVRFLLLICVLVAAACANPAVDNGAPINHVVWNSVPNFRLLLFKIENNRMILVTKHKIKLMKCIFVVVAWKCHHLSLSSGSNYQHPTTTTTTKAPTTPSKTALEESFMKRLGTKCTQKDNSSCVMLKLVSYMNRILKKSSIALGDSVELTRTRWGRLLGGLWNWGLSDN